MRHLGARSPIARRGRKAIISQCSLPKNASYVDVARALVHSRCDWLVEPPVERHLAIQLIEMDQIEREVREVHSRK